MMMQSRAFARLLVRHSSTAAPTVTLSPVAANFPAGSGGRHSNSGITATVFGSYGFVGRYVMNELGSCGSRVYAPFRGDEHDIREVQQMFDHGQFGKIPFSPRDHDSIRKSMKESDVVINLIGKHYETKHLVPTRRANGELSRINYSLEEVNVTIPRTLAKLAREAGVPSFIHMSCMASDPESDSRFNRTKAEGEKAVREEFPSSIIVKPANIFGHEDRFLNWFGMAATTLKFYPLINNGDTLVQPVAVEDVAKAIMEIVWNRHDFAGADFHLAGPDEFSYKEICELVADVTRLKVPMVALPEPVAEIAGKISEQFIAPFFTSDSIKQMVEDNVLRISPEEAARKPARRIGNEWSAESRFERFAEMVANNDPRVASSSPEILSAEEAGKRIVQENKGHRFTFEDLGIEPTGMDAVAFDFLRRFRKGGKFSSIQGYKK